MSRFVEIVLGITKPKIIFISLFFGVIVFILSNNLLLSTAVFLLVDSFYGFLDVWYNERKTILEKRFQASQSVPIFFTFKVAKESLVFQRFEEFKYEEFNFKIPVEQNPPASISYPLCPKCDGFFVESIEKNFPFRLSIIFKCNICNISYKSKFTRNELVQKVAQHYGKI